MSDTDEIVDEIDTPPELDDVDVRTVIDSFLAHFQNPTDAQAHALAELVGLTPAQLEAVIYEMLGEAVGEEDQDGVDDTEFEAEDALDVFILTYFLFNPTPSDDQIHQLAALVGVSTEEFEERIYKMLDAYEFPDQQNLEVEE